MKKFSLLAFLIAIPVQAAPLESFHCANSKLSVDVTRDTGFGGASVDTGIRLSYVDWNGVVERTYNSQDPDFLPDARGFRTVRLVAANDETFFYQGKFKLDVHALTVQLDGELALGAGAEPLTIRGTYLCQRN